MVALDYVVLAAYFVVMTLIGVLSMLKIKKQEDFFLGSRAFGKIFQAFAAFGAGTGSYDPVATGRTTYTSGLSGVWVALLWLFVTPFYWIAGVWYRRMRHLMLGDWFVERYQSKSLGVAYMFYGIALYAVALAVGFSAIGKVGAPLIGAESLRLPLLADPVSIEVVLVSICGLVVLVYGVLGGLRAAYWTDLIQGIFIILLSVLLIPTGLDALVDKFGDPEEMNIVDGFELMHDRVPDEYFEIIESPRGGEFPLHYIVAISILNLIGIVVQPHFIATGGGSAKTETSARVGLVAGNFMKRFCTIGWALTCLIVLALMADSAELVQDPDRVWGVAAREILGPFNLGLCGLMLACLMAALMSSASCYMLVVSGLVVRNFYAAYINPNASEKTYVLAGRLVGVVVIVGGVSVSLYYLDVFEQLKITWELPILFAAPFWVGMYWRRATKLAAWLTMLFTAMVFFVAPAVLPRLMPGLAEDPHYTVTNPIITTIGARRAAPADIARRNAEIALWDAGNEALRKKFEERPELLVPGPTKAEVAEWNAMVAGWDEGREEIRSKFEQRPERLDAKVIISEAATRYAQIALWDRGDKQIRREFPERPKPLAVGSSMAEVARRQAQIALWDRPDEEVRRMFPRRPEPLTLGSTIPDEFTTGGKPVYWKGKVEPIGEKHLKLVRYEKKADTLVIHEQYDCPLRAEGLFNHDFLVYELVGIDLTKMSNAALETLRLPLRVVLPFVVMVLLSLITPRVDKRVLDRYYVKMRTPVDPDPAADKRLMEASYRDTSRWADRRLFRFFGLEFQKPKLLDIAGFVISFIICFAIIAFMVWLAKLGS